MKRIVQLSLALLAAAVATFAADNATGTWKWSFATQNGEPFDTVMKLKQDGEKIMGSLNNRFGESQIADGKIKDGKISFESKRNLNGQDFLIKYSGKLEGDKITGKTEFTRDGQTRERDWEAKREGSKPASTLAGAWNFALIINDGNRIEGSLKLKQDGDKITGAMFRNEEETPMQEVKLTGDEIAFKVISNRDGRKVTANYKGKISADSIKGKVESDWSGESRTLDWEASRAK